MGIIAYFANNSVAANLIMGLLLIGGLISGFGLNAQVFPTLNPGIITVVVPYPGATPDEVEKSITRRVEEAVLGIEGVDEVRSSAADRGVAKLTGVAATGAGVPAKAESVASLYSAWIARTWSMSFGPNSCVR